MIHFIRRWFSANRSGGQRKKKLKVYENDLNSQKQRDGWNLTKTELTGPHETTSDPVSEVSGAHSVGSDCRPAGCSPPGPSVHGILTHTPEWAAFLFSGWGDVFPTQVSRVVGGFFTVWATGEARCFPDTATLVMSPALQWKKVHFHRNPLTGIKWRFFRSL